MCKMFLFFLCDCLIGIYRDDPDTSWFFVLSSCEDLHSWSSVTSTKEFAQQLFCCRQTIQNHERHVFDDLLIYFL